MNIASTPFPGLLPAAQSGTLVSASGGASLPPLSTFAELLGSVALPGQPQAGAAAAAFAPFSLDGALASPLAQPEAPPAGLQMTAPVPVAPAEASLLLEAQSAEFNLQLPQSSELASALADEAGKPSLGFAPPAPALLKPVSPTEPLVAAPAPGRQPADPAASMDATPEPEPMLPAPAAMQPGADGTKGPNTPVLANLADVQSSRFATAGRSASKRAEAVLEQASEPPQQQSATLVPNAELAERPMGEAVAKPELLQPKVVDANPAPELPQQQLAEGTELEAGPNIITPAAQERPTTPTLTAPSAAAPSTMTTGSEAAAPAPQPGDEQAQATRNTAPLLASTASADRLPVAESSTAPSGPAPAAIPTSVSPVGTIAPQPVAAAPTSFAPAAPLVTEAGSFAPSQSPEPEVTARPGEIGRQLGVEIARRVAAGADELLVRLNPQEMGRIEVRMHFNEAGSLRAHVVVESAAALEMLQRDAGDLGRALADAGVRADQQSLKFDGRGSGDAGSAWNRHGRDGEQRRSPEQHAGFESGEGEEAAYRPVRAQGRIDLMA